MVESSDLAMLLETQRRLQERSFGVDVSELEGEEFLEFVRWNVLALTDELHEMLQECSWKPWAVGVSANRPRMHEELIDALHFMLNLFLTINGPASSEEVAALIVNGYLRKAEVNAKRQADGYDGISTKCEGCHRDHDEAGVTELKTVFGEVVAHYCDACGKAVHPKPDQGDADD